MGIFQVRNRINSTTHVDLSAPAYNIMHVQITPDPVSDADVQAAVDDIRDFYTALAGHFTNGTSIVVGERVVRVDTVPGQLRTITPRTVVGTGGTSATVVEAAMVVSWRTGLVGPRFRGRTYLGPLSTAIIATNGTFTSGAVTGTQTAATGLLTAFAANPTFTRLMVFHRDTLTGDIVSSAFVDGSPDTQRRRGS